MLNLKKETIALLDDIENRIDANVEDKFIQQFDDFVHKKFKGVYFDPMREKTAKAKHERQDININDAILDCEIMLVDQMQDVSRKLEAGKGLLNVRSNYGTGILPSVFGAKIFTMPRHTNTLPTSIHLENEEKISELLEKGVPDLTNGFGANVFEMLEFYNEVFNKYPKISKYVDIFHPDAQGPLDVCELLWGSDLFYALYDDPDMVHDVLGLITETYIKFMDKWFSLCAQKRDWATHWEQIAHLGKVVIRNDSAMNLSPEMYAEFAKPYDEKILNHFGGGCVHFCGRGDHYIEQLGSISKLTAVNLSQPHLNDMEKIYKNTVDKGIQIVGFSKEWLVENDIRNGDYKNNLSV